MYHPYLSVHCYIMKRRKFGRPPQRKEENTEYTCKVNGARAQTRATNPQR